MPKITLRPSGQTVELDEKTNFLQGLRAAGVYIKSSCGGVASCTDCIVKIVSGEGNLTPPPFPELKLLGNVFHITKERLACQTCATGDVTLDLSGHDKAADEAKLRKKPFSRPKNPGPVVRKKDVVEKIREERENNAANAPKAPAQQDQPWFKHWEKGDKDPARKDMKGQSGFKKPKAFNTDNLDEVPEKQASKADAPARPDFRSERDKKKD